MSVRRLIESEKLAQAVDENPKRLMACAEYYHINEINLLLSVAVRELHWNSDCETMNVNK